MDARETFHALLHGRGSLRFIVQPIVAILLGLRDGRRDAAAQRAPFLLSLITQRHSRADLAHELIRAIAIPFTLAITADMILQKLITHRDVLWISALVGMLLVALPYSLSRGLTNRGARRIHRRAEG